MKLLRMTWTPVLLAAITLASPSFGQPADDHHPSEETQGTGSQEMPGQGMMQSGQVTGSGMQQMGAQKNTGTPATSGPMMGMMGMMGPGGMMESHVEGRLAFLKTELGITRSQKRAWNAFADAMRASARSMSDMQGQMMGAMGQGMPSVTTMLDIRISMMENRLAAMKALKPATDALYSALSAKQRKKADQLMLGVGFMM